MKQSLTDYCLGFTGTICLTFRLDEWDLSGARTRGLGKIFAIQWDFGRWSGRHGLWRLVMENYGWCGPSLGDREPGHHTSRDAWGDRGVGFWGAPRARELFRDKGLRSPGLTLGIRQNRATSVSQGSQEMLVGRRVRTWRHGQGGLAGLRLMGPLESRQFSTRLLDFGVQRWEGGSPGWRSGSVCCQHAIGHFSREMDAPPGRSQTMRRKGQRQNHPNSKSRKPRVRGKHV